MYSAIFGMVTNKQPTEQPGDPSASLLLTSVRRQSFAIEELKNWRIEFEEGELGFEFKKEAGNNCQALQVLNEEQIIIHWTSLIL